jgi:anti-sigma B factor antagonist
MEIDATVEGTLAVVKPHGKIDFVTSGEVDKKLTELADSGAMQFVIDMGDVPFVASAGLRALLKCTQPVQPQGGGIRLASVNQAVREVIEVSGFGEIMPIFEGEAEARADFN